MGGNCRVDTDGPLFESAAGTRIIRRNSGDNKVRVFKKKKKERITYFGDICIDMDTRVVHARPETNRITKSEHPLKG